MLLTGKMSKKSRRWHLSGTWMKHISFVSVMDQIFSPTLLCHRSRLRWPPSSHVQIVNYTSAVKVWVRVCRICFSSVTLLILVQTAHVLMKVHLAVLQMPYEESLARPCWPKTWISTNTSRRVNIMIIIIVRLNRMKQVHVTLTDVVMCKMHMRRFVQLILMSRHNTWVVWLLQQSKCMS